MNESSADHIRDNFISLKFVGVFGNGLTEKEAEVKPYLLYIVHNNGKQNSRTEQEMCGTAIVKINPNDSTNIGKILALSIPIDKTRRLNESVHLRLNVKVLEKSLPRPLWKRNKNNNIIYESELTVVDTLQRRLVLNGEHELPLQPARNLHESQVISNIHLVEKNIDNQNLPRLKFYLEWTRDKFDGLVDRPATICINESNNENSADQNWTGSSQRDSSGLSSLTYLNGSSVQRTVVSETLFRRPNRPKRKLPEYIEIDESVDEVNNQEAFITGDDRLGDQSDLHVAPNGIDVEPEDENTIPQASSNESDIDSEDENMPGWFQIKTKTMIDELAGVNEGEKALMKIWNVHIMKCGYYVSDIKLQQDCESFIEQKGLHILQMKLYNNFVLHMVNLYDHRIISPQFFHKCFQRLQELARDNNIKL